MSKMILIAEDKVKLALEALEGSIALTMAKIDRRHKAITALREALASEAIEQPAQRKPWVGLTTDEVYKLHTKAIADNHRHLESRRGKQLGREDERIAFYARALEAKLKEENT